MSFRTAGALLEPSCAFCQRGPPPAEPSSEVFSELSEALLSSPELSGKLQNLSGLILCRSTRQFSTEGYRQTYRLYPLLKEPLVSFAASSSFLLSPLFYLSAMFYVGLIWSIYSEEPPVSCGWIILGG